MVTLKLTPNEYAALDLLEEGQELELTYKGLYCFLCRDDYGGIVFNGKHFYLGFYNIDEAVIREINQ